MRTRKRPATDGRKHPERTIPRKERQGIDHKQLEHKRKQARKGVTP